MDENQENRDECLKAAIEALKQHIKRLAVQSNLYEFYQVQSGFKDYEKRKRVEKALAYLQILLSADHERFHRNH